MTATATQLYMGDHVLFQLRSPGGSAETCRVLLEVECIVLGDGQWEHDLLIHPGQLADGLEDINDALVQCDMCLDDIQEGPVYVLRNCQPQDMILVRRAA